MNYSKTQRLFIISITMLSLLSLACSDSLPEESIVTINGIEIPVEVAKTSAERQKGLMNRKNLNKERGMLFVFKEEQRLSFWMKNTSIPLSIAYISKSGEIKEILNMKPFSESSVKSKWSVKYALEVNLGFFSENGINPGDMVEIESLFK